MDGDSPNGYASALVDDVRVYSRALSADEIKRLYIMGHREPLNVHCYDHTPSQHPFPCAYLAPRESVAALVFSFARFPQTAPLAPAHTALATASKTELAATRSPPGPRRRAVPTTRADPADLATYTHPVYGFSFPYFKDFTVQEIQD